MRIRRLLMWLLVCDTKVVDFGTEDGDSFEMHVGQGHGEMRHC